MVIRIMSRYKIPDLRFVAKLLNSLIVDDFVGGGATTQESMELYQKTQSRKRFQTQEMADK